MHRTAANLAAAACALIVAAGVGAEAGVYTNIIVSEVMYDPPWTTNGTPYQKDDFEYIEVCNAGTSSLDLYNCRFTKGINFTFPHLTLATGRYAIVVNNLAAFKTRYSTNGIRVAGTWTNGNQLSNGGEQITLVDAGGATIRSFTYSTNWQPMANGNGFSIVPVNVRPGGNAGTSTYWRLASRYGGSPGRSDPAPYNPPVVINEALVHTDWPQQDAIEMWNMSATNVDLGYWWLSDNPLDPMMYQIQTGTVIVANGYSVIYGDNDADPWNNAYLPPQFFGRSFMLSELGERVYLYSPDLRYTNGFEFPASLNGQSFGRWVTSDGVVHHPPQESLTLGATNSGPVQSPVVISEILLDPAQDDVQFIELWNRSDKNVELYHYRDWDIAWRVEGIEFEFDWFTEIGADERIVLIPASVDEAAFRKMHRTHPYTWIYPWTGTLSNAVGALRILAPETPELNGDVPYYVMDEVCYLTNSFWPNPTGKRGRSLCRRSPDVYGSEPTNWYFSTYGGTPGEEPLADEDADGMGDAWETANGLSSAAAGDGSADTDGDGVTNFVEFLWGIAATNSDSDHDNQSDAAEILAGTHPGNPTSRFEFAFTRQTSGVPVVTWPGASGRSYRVESCTDILIGSWTNLPAWTSITGHAGFMTWTGGPSDNVTGAFYRVNVRRR